MNQDWRLIALVVLIVSSILASQCEAAKGRGKGKDKDNDKDDEESKENKTTAAPDDTQIGADSERQSSNIRRCKEKCRNVNSPVCGTDLITYQNKCLMARAACESEKKLTVRNRGKCPPDLDSRKCPTSCRGVPDKPICDQAGMLHDNLCQFKMDQCGFPKRKVYHENSDRCVKQSSD